MSCDGQIRRTPITPKTTLQYPALGLGFLADELPTNRQSSLHGASTHLNSTLRNSAKGSSPSATESPTSDCIVAATSSLDVFEGNYIPYPY